MLEIERKFLVNSTAYKKAASHQTRITQGYLSIDPERTVRVRIKGNQSYLTIKGKSNASGTTRFEWEKEIPYEEGLQLISLCLKTVIDKIRYMVPIENHTYEVDEFLGDNKGLIIAEIELNTEGESFYKPSWLSKEVTGDSRYYNSYISSLPFNLW